MSAQGAKPPLSDVWAAGHAYEPYIGRWSRLVAREFIGWLAQPPNQRWLDIGCGTGALTQTILNQAVPKEVISIDPSEGFIAYARHHIRDPRAKFQTGNALQLAFKDGEFDAAVSGLVLNFVPDTAKAVSEMTRAVRPGGTVAAYVWDYAGEMQLLRHFWDAAVALDSAARDLDEGPRFPICQLERLRALFDGAGLKQTEVRTIDVPTVFKNFDDFWSPFLGGQGPAPTYCMALSEERRSRLKERLEATLPTEPDGSIRLIARAFAVRAVKAA
jgi:SAM-dependent methyltransferase